MKRFALLLSVALLVSCSTSPKDAAAPRDAAALDGSLDHVPGLDASTEAGSNLDASADGGAGPSEGGVPEAQLQRLAVTIWNSAGWRVLLLAMDGGRAVQRREIASGPGAGSISLSFSPDGRWLAFGGTNERDRSCVFVHEVASGVTKVLTELSPTFDSFELAWAPDSARLAVQMTGKTEQKIEVHKRGADGFTHLELRSAPNERLVLADGERSWSRTGQSLAFFTSLLETVHFGGDSMLRRTLLDSDYTHYFLGWVGRTETALGTDGEYAYTIDASSAKSERSKYTPETVAAPERPLIAYASEPPEVAFEDVEDRGASPAPATFPTQGPWSPIPIIWSSDGRRLFTKVLFDEPGVPAHMFYAEADADGAWVTRPVTKGAVPEHQFNYKPLTSGDGRWLYSHDGGSLEAGTDLLIPVGGTPRTIGVSQLGMAPLDDLRFSPDDRWLIWRHESPSLLRFIRLEGKQGSAEIDLNVGKEKYDTDPRIVAAYIGFDRAHENLLIKRRRELQVVELEPTPRVVRRISFEGDRISAAAWQRPAELPFFDFSDVDF